MALELQTDFAPMEAKSMEAIPKGSQWLYEPKWDGFRCIVFREGNTIHLLSKSGQPLARYFPELVAALLELKPKQFVLDGEIVVPEPDNPDALSFDSLLQRVHPAESRIRRLSEETPARLIIFDLLAGTNGKSLATKPLTERKAKLQTFADKHLSEGGTIQLSPATTDYAQAKDWFSKAGKALDGIMAKQLDQPYHTGKREGMVKIKPKRTADCVVGGFRYASKEKVVGSLLLGLYDTDGLLHHVGYTSAFTAAQRRELTPKLEALAGGTGFTGQAPGGPSRWSTERSAQWVPLKPTLVVEVAWDHFTGGRFRHGTKIIKWRPDKPPKKCTMDQVEL